MSREFFYATIAVFILAVVQIGEAQQPARIYRIGYLWPTRPEQGQSRFHVFKLGMGDLGYAVGKNLVIESRWADGKSDRLADLAADLVRLNVDVIVTGVNAGVVAAKQATSTIPIVMTSGNDPIGSGLVAKSARPGGNVTGLTIDTGEKNFGKRLELTKELSGNLSRVAVLFNGTNAAHQLYLKNLDQPARSLKLTLVPLEYREAGDFEKAFKAMTAKHVGGMFLFSDGVSADQRTVIASLAMKNGCRVFIRNDPTWRQAGSCLMDRTSTPTCVALQRMWTKSSKAPNPVSFRLSNLQV